MPKITNSAFVLDLGKLLQRRREAIGMTRDGLAEKIGTKYEVIRLYEEGQRVMKIDRLFEILEALGIPTKSCLSVILGGTGTQGIHALNLAAQIYALDDSVRQKLLRQVNALIDIENADRP